MSVTSTGADFSACAAHRPPNPPPTMMTFARLFMESLVQKCLRLAVACTRRRFPAEYALVLPCPMKLAWQVFHAGVNQLSRGRRQVWEYAVVRHLVVTVLR